MGILKSKTVKLSTGSGGGGGAVPGAHSARHARIPGGPYAAGGHVRERDLRGLQDIREEI